MIKDIFKRFSKAVNAPLDKGAANFMKAAGKRDHVLDAVLGTAVLGGAAGLAMGVTQGRSPIDTSLGSNDPHVQAGLGIGAGTLLVGALGVGAAFGLGKVGRMRAGGVASMFGKLLASPVRFLASQGANGKMRNLTLGDSIGATIGALGREVGDVLAPLERVARIGLTHSNKSATRAWFPYFHKAPADDLRKYALNPRVGTNLFAMGAGVAAVGYASNMSGISDRVRTPQTQFYHDGTSLRHMNDLGADYNYGQKIMGSASNQFQQERYNQQRGLY